MIRHRRAITLAVPNRPSGPWLGAASNPIRLCRGLAALAGRATIVPFLAVLTGPQRTITGNTTAAVTCADHRFPR